MLQIVQLPLLKDNYGYLLHDNDTSDTAVVDPSEASPVLEALKQRGWDLKYILNTHHHFDHVGGNKELKAATGCTIICSHTDLVRIPEADKGVREDQQLSIGNSTAQIIELPGHTIGQIAFYFANEKAIFCGDTLFSLGCGRLFEGTPAQMWNSLLRLAGLPRDTKVYCGHEYTEANGRFALSIDPNNQALRDYCHHVADLRAARKPTIPSTIDLETKTNPFLRAPQLISALGLPDSTLPHEAFAKIRQLKDNFS